MTGPLWEPPVSPQDYAAEQAILAALLANNGTFGRIVGVVEASDFADPLHGRIFTAACLLIERGQTADALTLGAHFAQDPGLADSATRGYLARLQANPASLLSVGDYAQVVRDLAERRRLIAACEAAISDARRSAIDRPAWAIAADLAAAVHGQAGDLAPSIAGLSEGMVNGLNADLGCTATGLACLDAVIGGGFQAGKFYGIEAYKKSGKTLLLGSIAYNITMAGVPTLFLNLEMGAEEQATRLLARQMAVNSLAFLDPMQRRARWFQERAAQAVMTFRTHDYLRLLRRPRPDLPALLAVLGQAALGHGIRGVFVDYLQLIRGRQPGDSLASHYDEVAQSLAEAAVRYGIWIVAAAQLNRQGEVRQGDGLENACDLALRLHAVDELTAPRRFWLQMVASRYTPLQDIGTESEPALELDLAAGPHIRERIPLALAG